MKRTELARIWAPPAAAALLIFALSAVPNTAFPTHREPAAAAVHLLEFGALAFLVARALARSRPGLPTLVTVAISFSFCVIYGAVDELHQMWVPTRVFDLGDLAFDVLGAALGAAAFRRWRGYPPRAQTAGEGDG